MIPYSARACGSNCSSSSSMRPKETTAVWLPNICQVPAFVSAMLCVARAVLCLVSLLVPAYASAQTDDMYEQMRTEPAALHLPLGAACRDCHQAEYDVWSQSQHARGYMALHRTTQARAIADAMGESLIKRDSLCLRCHYTPVATTVEANEQNLAAGAGVSCQSCHGEARDWINVHYDFGVNGTSLAEARASESAQHRAQRQARSRAAGMITGSDLIEMVSACLDCHAVAGEQLLDRSRHPAGNPDFEFVSWVNSRIRHGFLESSLAGGSPMHAAWPADRRRVAYVVGRLVELEHALRALARTRRFGRHSRVYEARVEAAKQRLSGILESAEVSAAREALAAVAGLELAPDRNAPLTRAADTVAVLARQFVDTNSGSSLAGIDSLIAAAASRVPLMSRACAAGDCDSMQPTGGMSADAERDADADSGPDEVGTAPRGGQPVSITPLIVPRSDDAR